MKLHALRSELFTSRSKVARALGAALCALCVAAVGRPPLVA